MVSDGLERSTGHMGKRSDGGSMEGSQSLFLAPALVSVPDTVSVTETHLWAFIYNSVR